MIRCHGFYFDDINEQIENRFVQLFEFAYNCSGQVEALTAETVRTWGNKAKFHCCRRF